MPDEVKLIDGANGRRRVPYHVNPDMFASRALQFGYGRLVPTADIAG